MVYIKTSLMTFDRRTMAVSGSIDIHLVFILSLHLSMMHNVCSAFHKTIHKREAALCTSCPSRNRRPPNLENTVPFSCAGHCGSSRQQLGGCSCDVTCAVYGNCCADFDTRCPDVLEDSRARFGHMMASDTTCVSDGVFVVTSCPREPYSPLSSWQQENQDGGSLETMFRKQQEVGELSKPSQLCWEEVLVFENTIREHNVRPKLSENMINEYRAFSRLHDNFMTQEESRTRLTDNQATDDSDRESIKRQISHTTQESLTDSSDRPLTSTAQKPVTSENKLNLSDELNIIDAFKQRYVTDMSTGFVFANLTLFACHASRDSVPCLWGLRLGINYYKKSTQHTTLIKPSTVHYTPNTLDRYLKRMCDPAAVDACDNTSQFFTQDLQTKCAARFSYAFSMETLDVYKNKHCLQCNVNESFQELNLDGQNSKLTEFSELFRVTALSGSEFKLQQSGGNGTSSRQDWMETDCIFDNGFSCSITECGQSYVKMPNGECRHRLFLHMSVRITNEIFTAEEHRRLASFFQCVIRNFDSLQIDEDVAPKFSVYFFGKRLKMYGVVFSVFSTLTKSIHNLNSQLIYKFVLPMTVALREDLGYDIPDIYLSARTEYLLTKTVQVKDHVILKSDRDHIPVTLPFAVGLSDYEGNVVMTFENKVNSTDFSSRYFLYSKQDACIVNYSSSLANLAKSTQSKVPSLGNSQSSSSVYDTAVVAKLDNACVFLVVFSFSFGTEFQ